MTEKIQTTYAELRDGDVLVDRSGGRWHVSGVVHHDGSGGAPKVDFWLGDVRTKVRQHHMTKPAGDACTVERVPLPVVHNARNEEGYDRTTLAVDPWQTLTNESGAHQAAVDAVEQITGAKIEVDVTTAELDAAVKATDDEPVVLPLFESMTDLEQRSHMFVLHGVFTEDIEDRIERVRVHAAAHQAKAQGRLKGRHTPHTHSEGGK